MLPPYIDPGLSACSTILVSSGCGCSYLLKDIFMVHGWQVNLVEWLKMMVGNRRAEEVVDPNLEVKPNTRALKRALLVALRCVDPDSEKRPRMSQVVRMLETEEVPYREVQSIPDFHISTPYSILISLLFILATTSASSQTTLTRPFEYLQVKYSIPNISLSRRSSSAHPGRSSALFLC